MKKFFKEYAMTLSLIWAGCFIIFLFTYMLVLKPQAKVKREISRQLQEKKQDYMATYETSNEEVKKQLVSELEEIQKMLGNYVADERAAANLTFDISRIANENSVLTFSVRSKSNKGTVEIPDCKLIGEERLDVSFNSNFRQFAMFLNALERHVPVIFVDSFSISNDKGGDENARVNMSLSVFVEMGYKS